MWSALVAGVLGLLALAVNAEWLAGRWARTRRRIRAEADLLEHLPPGIGQRLLRARIDDAVLTYVVRRDTALPKDLVNRFWWWTSVGIAGIAASFAGQVFGFTQDSSSAGTWLAWAGLGVMSVGIFGMRRVERDRKKWWQNERRAHREELERKYREGYLRVLNEEKRTHDPKVKAPPLDMAEFAGDTEEEPDEEVTEPPAS